MAKRSWIWLILLLSSLSFPVSAVSASGSICLTMQFQGTPVSGGTVTLYEVTEMDHSEKPEELLKIVRSGGHDGVTREVTSDGTVCFFDLKEGCYLLSQETAPEGYYVMKPFLVSIPITVGGEVQYHVEGTPKLQRIPETKLPQTGMHILPVWGLLGGGLVLTALGLLLQKRK